MLWSVAIGLVALIARLIVAINVPDTEPLSDMAEYWERALYIFDHGRLYDSSFRTPAYPAALALAFRLGSGPTLSAARMLNVAAGVVTALLTYWFARRTAGPRSSAVAALVVALYPSLLMHTALVATEALVMVPLLGALIAATYTGPRAALAAGLFVGLSALIRPAGVALLPAILLACARGPLSAPPVRKWRMLLHPALASIMFGLTLSPWWLHNAHVHRRFIPLDTGFGVNLMVGNGPYAVGMYESSILGPLLTDPDSRTPEGSDRLAAQAVEYMRAHPVETLALIPRKIEQLFAMDWRDPGFLYSWSYFGPLQPATIWWLGLATVGAFPLLLAAAIAGLSVRDGLAHRVLVPSLLFVAATVVMHAILFGEARYHLPLVPVLAVLATDLSRWRAGIVPWRLGLGAVVFLWLSVAAWSPQLETIRTLGPKLARPDGWQLRLSYDDLLPLKRQSLQ